MLGQVTFVKLIVIKRRRGQFVAWIIWLIHPDAIYIRQYVTVTKYDYSTEENVLNVSKACTICRPFSKLLVLYYILSIGYNM